MSIFCIGPNGEGIINSTHFATTTESVAPRSRSSIYNCSTSVLILATSHPLLALAIGWAGVLLARYLFFVSVVPLNMALTFVRTRAA